MGGTIVCGVTDTEEGRSAAQLAGALAARLALRLVLVHVVDGVPAGAQDSVTARQRWNGAERMLQELAGDAPVEPELRLVLGDRANAMANVAAEEGADLVVVGARSVGPRRRRLLSGLARELSSATPVPVVVAPPSRRKRSDHRLAVVEAAASR